MEDVVKMSEAMCVRVIGPRVEDKPKGTHMLGIERIDAAEQHMLSFREPKTVASRRSPEKGKPREGS